MNQILYNLCRHSLNIMDGWLPYPSTALSKHCNLSLYQTRKELKRLKQLGLVDSDIQTISDDERTYILRGYTITKEAKKTDEYKKAHAEEREICLKVFGMDIIGEIND